MLGQTLNSFEKTLQKVLHSPFGLQVSILAFFIIFISGFQPTYMWNNEEPFGEMFFHEEKAYSISESGFIDNFAGIENAGLEEVVIKDKDGNLVKKVQPRQLTKSIDYIIKSGDTLLKISHKFGLNVSTLLWANNLTAKETIQPGQKIKIPPADGVYYTVELGDTLGEIAQWHDISLADVYKYNQFDDKATIHRGKEIFLPGAKKIYVEHTPFQPQISSVASSAKPMQSVGFRLRKPTTGTLTQGVRPGHTAIDIANKINTPIYSAYDGVVITSKDGWNYGYGKYIIVDHGNNVHTLYAHLNGRSVREGQRVRKGELIGKMGNSGNVIGPTGIHLHFEVRIGGRKVNPNTYF